ncbi:MAG: hypothetical protein ACYTEZ_01030 [Planctomycetota bacterium]|jgi:hypothetical protein
MNPALFGGAAALYLACGVLYYRGHFGLATLAGLLFFAALAPVVLAALGPVAGGGALALLAAAPLAYLAVHALDARRGLFLLPTIYSIPIAFVCGVTLWILTGLALLL